MIRAATTKLPKLLASRILLCGAALYAQNGPRSVALSDTSGVPAGEILRVFGKQCSDVAIASDLATAPYVLEATKAITRSGLRIERVVQFDLAVSDRDGTLVGQASDTSLKSAVKEICRVIKTSVAVEVVDTQNLKLDRQTHTEASTIYVIVNGEHALFDCFERDVICATIRPGKYYAEQGGDGVWVTYRMPITHKAMRNHYKLSGSW